MDLDHQAKGLVLVHLVLASRKRRVKGDARVEVRRHGHDHKPRIHGGTLGNSGHAVAAVGVFLPIDGAHRTVKYDVGTQFRCLQQGHLLHPADDPLVQDEILISEVAEGPGGGCHQHRLQGREGVRGLGEHAARDEQADVVARLLIVGVPPQPVVEGDGVQFTGLGVCPGLGGADFRGEAVQNADELVHFRTRGFTHRKGITGVAGPLAVPADIDGFALTVAGVGLQSELLKELQQCRLVRGDPLAPDFQHGPVNRVGPGSAAHAVPCFQHCHAQASFLQLAGSGEPGRSGANDHNVAVKIQHDVLSVAVRVTRTTK